MGETAEFWILQTIAMLLTALLIPRFWFRGWLSAIIMVGALVTVNSTIWDSALFLSIPSTLTTHTAAILAANGAVFWILAKLLPGVEMRGVLPAIVAPVVFSFMSILVYQYGKGTDWNTLAQQAMGYITEVKSTLQKEKPKTEVRPVGPGQF